MNTTPHVPSAADVELVEAEAWAELQMTLSPDFRARMGISVIRRNGGVLLIAGRSPALPTNRAMGLGLVAPLTQDDLDRVIADYSAAGVAQFILQWSPAAEPADVSDWLIARGFTLLSRPVTKLYRRAGHASVDVGDARLSVVEVGPEYAQVFEALVAQPLGVPEGLGAGIRSTLGSIGWRYYLVFDGDRPIAGSVLYIRGRMSWCGLGATIESFRRRGAQTAMLARRVRDAAAAGCDWVTADTLAETADRPSQSLRNMHRAGFVALYNRPTFLFDFGSL